MKKQFFLLLLLIFTFSNAFSQIVNYPSNDALNGYQFANIYSNEGSFSKTAKSLTSNDFYIGGTIKVNNINRLTITKTDPKGQVIFAQHYDLGTNDPTAFNDFVPLPNGDLMVLGRIDGSTDYISLMRITDTGTLLWSKKYHFTSFRYRGSKLIQLNNSTDFVFSSWRWGDDVALIKVDINGTVLASTRIGDGSDDQINHIIPVGTGCAIVGSTSSGPGWNGFIVELDNDLTVTSKKLIGTNNSYNEIRDVKLLDNGNYLLIGDTENDVNSVDNFDGFVAEYNPNVSTFTGQTFAAKLNREVFYEAHKINDGYIITGLETTSWSSTVSRYCLKIDENYNFKWAKYLDFSSSSFLYDIQQFSTDKITATGISNGHPLLMQTSTDLDDCISTPFDIDSVYQTTFFANTWNTTVQSLPITTTDITNSITNTAGTIPTFDTYLPNLYDNRLLCGSETATFDIGSSFTNPIWQDGSNGMTYTSAQSEIVTIEATNLLGRQCSDTAIIALSNLNIINQDTTMSAGESIVLYSNADTVLVEEFVIESDHFFDYLFPTINGQNYLVQVEGLYTVSSTLFFDGPFVFDNNGSTAPYDFFKDAPYNTIRPLNDVFNPNHQYDFLVPGDGTPIRFWVKSNDYTISSGELTVRIYRLPNPIWSTGETTASISVTPTDTTTTYYLSNGSLNCADSVTVNLIFKPCIEDDSLALVNLYNALGGLSSGLTWDLTHPVSTWQGVILDPSGCNVVGLFLNNRNLQGTFPPLNLPFLITLDVSKNELTNINCGFNTPYLSSLFVYDNRFTFDSNFGCFPNATTVNYANQKCVSTVFNNDILSVNVGGNIADNTYHWYRNGVLAMTIVGNNTYVPTLAGDYHCLVSNSIITQPLINIQNLLMCSEPFFVYKPICNFGALNLGPDRDVCDSVFTISSRPDMLSYNWNTGETTENITVNTAGMYLCTVIDSCNTASTDSIYISFNCLYDIGDIDTNCIDLNSSSICVPFKNTAILANGIIGYDISMTYDTSKLMAKPGFNNGALYLGNVLSNNGAYSNNAIDYFIYAPTGSNIITISLHYNQILTNVMASTTLIDDLFCLEFDLKSSFDVGETANFSIVEVKENFNTYFRYSAGKAGHWTISGDTVLNGRVIYHNDIMKPFVGNNLASPTNIVETDNACVELNNIVAPDNTGRFNINLNHSAITVNKDISNNLSFMDILPVLNGQDQYLAGQTAVNMPLGLTVYQFIALDVNKDGFITALDRDQITDRIFGQIVEFSGSTGATPDVEFCTDNTVQNNPNFSTYDNTNVPIIDPCLDVTTNYGAWCNTYDSLLIHGIVKGDADQSWTGNPATQPNWRNADNIRLDINNIVMENNACIFNIPVYYTNTASNLTALDFHINFDENNLTILNVIAASPAGNDMEITYDTINGVLLLSSYSTIFGGVQTNAPLYYIQVQAANNSVRASDFSNEVSYMNGIPSVFNVNGVFYPSNHQPHALNDNSTTTQNIPVNIDVLANDNDIDGDDLTISIFPSSTNVGTVTKASDSTFTYLPPTNFVGTDVFTYQVCDNDPCNNQCDIATVVVNVTTTTSSSEMKVNERINVYPNPFSDVVFVEIVEGNNMIESIEIFDIQGKLIRSHTFNMVKEATIPTNYLADGVYILRINGIIHERIIKN